MTGEKEVLKTTCPRDCYDACGIVAIKRDGAITRVLGDPDHPVSRGALCGKCALAYNGVFRDPEIRLQTPLKRTGAKGEGRFEPVWGVRGLFCDAGGFERHGAPGSDVRFDRDARACIGGGRKRGRRAMRSDARGAVSAPKST